MKIDIKNFTNEKEALEALVDAFAEEMKHKLLVKLTDGETGWNDKDWAQSHGLGGAFMALLQHLIAAEPDMVDVANFAAFIWNAQDDVPIGTGKGDFE